MIRFPRATFAFSSSSCFFVKFILHPPLPRTTERPMRKPRSDKNSQDNVARTSSFTMQYQRNGNHARCSKLRIRVSAGIHPVKYYRRSLFDLPHHDPEGLEASKYPISTMTLFHGVNVPDSLQPCGVISRSKTTHLGRGSYSTGQSHKRQPMVRGLPELVGFVRLVCRAASISWSSFPAMDSCGASCQWTVIQFHWSG